jgi:hypothetical protein
MKSKIKRHKTWLPYIAYYFRENQYDNDSEVVIQLEECNPCIARHCYDTFSTYRIREQRYLNVVTKRYVLSWFIATHLTILRSFVTSETRVPVFFSVSTVGRGRSSLRLNLRFVYPFQKYSARRTGSWWAPQDRELRDEYNSFETGSRS